MRTVLKLFATAIVAFFAFVLPASAAPSMSELAACVLHSMQANGDTEATASRLRIGRTLAVGDGVHVAQDAQVLPGSTYWAMCRNYVASVVETEASEPAQAAPAMPAKPVLPHRTRRVHMQTASAAMHTASVVPALFHLAALELAADQKISIEAPAVPETENMQVVPAEGGPVVAIVPASAPTKTQPPAAAQVAPHTSVPPLASITRPTYVPPSFVRKPPASTSLARASAMPDLSALPDVAKLEEIRSNWVLGTLAVLFFLTTILTFVWHIKVTNRQQAELETYIEGAKRTTRSQRLQLEKAEKQRERAQVMEGVMKHQRDEAFAAFALLEKERDAWKAKATERLALLVSSAATYERELPEAMRQSRIYRWLHEPGIIPKMELLMAQAA